MPDGRAKVITRDLMPNGSNIPVTNENRLLYIAYVVRHRLHIQPYELTQAFLRGLGQIINPSWLSMFNQVELQTLIPIGYDGREHPTIRMFWQVMEEFKDEDRRKVLKYVTSTPRAPLLGFASLNPQFSIRDSSSDEDRLPSASTCVNLLKLPRYQSKEKLREKLLYAVNAGAGFDLS
ncbi:HECT-domain-containing protein [Botrytis cinerea]